MVEPVSNEMQPMKPEKAAVEATKVAEAEETLQQARHNFVGQMDNKVFGRLLCEEQKAWELLKALAHQKVLEEQKLKALEQQRPWSSRRARSGRRSRRPGRPWSGSRLGGRSRRPGRPGRMEKQKA